MQKTGQQRKWLALVLAGLAWTGGVGGLAAQASPPLASLPPEALVRAAIESSPGVQGSQARIRGEEANRRRLEAGPYEWNWRIGSQQRRSRAVDANPAEQFYEWNTALERPIRLPGKAEADSALGQQGVTIAELAHRDAIHEESRLLLGMWFNWLREEATTRQWREQFALLGKQAAAVARRQQLGDAARIESVQSQAALAQAEAALAQAESRRAVAREALSQRYPSLATVNLPDAVLPQPFDAGKQDWSSQLRDHNHELALVRAEAQKSQAEAARAQQERAADPAIGVQMGHERGGNEKVIGAYISIPLGGEVRRVQADVALANADAARHREAAVGLKIGQESASLLRSVTASFAAWQSAQAAGARLMQAAQMMGRAYQLGEGNLNDLLTAQRQANEAMLAAHLARLDALELQARVYLDAHQMWDWD